MSVIIKKRLLKKFPEEKIPLIVKGKQPAMLGADELIQDSYAFLKTFYRGCYDAYLTRVGYKTVFLSPENLAMVLKGLVKAVFGRQLIIIRFHEDTENLYIDYEFNTAFVTDEVREQLKELATEGGFKVEFSEGLVRIKIGYVQNAVPYVNSISTRIVYNTLVYIFQSKEY